jgi:hypothetical protein
VVSQCTVTIRTNGRFSQSMIDLFLCDFFLISLSNAFISLHSLLGLRDDLETRDMVYLYGVCLWLYTTNSLIQFITCFLVNNDSNMMKRSLDLISTYSMFSQFFTGITGSERILSRFPLLITIRRFNPAAIVECLYVAVNYPEEQDDELNNLLFDSACTDVYHMRMCIITFLLLSLFWFVVNLRSKSIILSVACAVSVLFLSWIVSKYILMSC